LSIRVDGRCHWGIVVRAVWNGRSSRFCNGQRAPSPAAMRAASRCAAASAATCAAVFPAPCDWSRTAGLRLLCRMPRLRLPGLGGGALLASPSSWRRINLRALFSTSCQHTITVTRVLHASLRAALLFPGLVCALPLTASHRSASAGRGADPGPQGTQRLCPPHNTFYCESAPAQCHQRPHPGAARGADEALVKADDLGLSQRVLSAGSSGRALVRGDSRDVGHHSRGQNEANRDPEPPAKCRGARVLAHAQRLRPK